MTDLSTSLAEPEAPDNSTQLDAPRPSDETVSTKPPVEEKKPPESRLDAIKRAADEVKPKEPAEKPAEVAEKPAETVKAEPAEKSASKDEAPQAKTEPERRQKDHIEPPEKFLPLAKEKWINTPREVKSEVQRVMAEAHEATTRAQESVKEYESLRPYAEMAKQGGTTLDAALGAYTRMENTFRTNPAEGFRGLMANMQMNPVQAIGHILAAYNVRPEQLAAHIAQSPNEYTALAQPQQRQQQGDDRVQSLEQQLAEMRESMQQQSIERDIISPFAAEHPRYHELQGVIASFLNSDMVPKSLSPQDRLAAAYDMAVRISPQYQREQAPEPTAAETSEGRAGDDFGGRKSVRGAPASGVETTNIRKGKLSRGDALKSAMAELGIA